MCYDTCASIVAYAWLPRIEALSDRLLLAMVTFTAPAQAFLLAMLAGNQDEGRGCVHGV